jgi:hypothetical protein
MNSPVPDLAEVDPRLPTMKVAQRYGVSQRTLERWEDDTELQFPKPVVIIHRRKYWSLRDLEVWERQLPLAVRSARAT